MKRKWLMAACCALLVPSLSFASTKVRFSFVPYAGMGSMSVREAVSEDRELVSVLKWNAAAFPVVGAKAQMSWLGLRVTLDGLAAVPLLCGALSDYDYSERKVVQFSEHDLSLDKLFGCTLWVGWSFNSPRYVPLHFQADAGLTFQMSKFSAFNGYLQYAASGGEWTGNEEKRAVQGNVISYEQAAFVFPKIRFCATHWFGDTAFFSLRVYYGGMLGSLDALDSHYLRKKQFHDSLKAGNCWGVEVCVRIKDVMLSGGYDFISTRQEGSATASGSIGVSAAGMTAADECWSSAVDRLWHLCIGWRF